MIKRHFPVKSFTTISLYDDAIDFIALMESVNKIEAENKENKTTTPTPIDLVKANPECWRGVIPLLPGKQPTVFTLRTLTVSEMDGVRSRAIGLVPPGGGNQDVNENNSRKWLAFCAACDKVSPIDGFDNDTLDRSLVKNFESVLHEVVDINTQNELGVLVLSLSSAHESQPNFSQAVMDPLS